MKTKLVRDFVDLRVYQGTFVAASEVFQITKRFPIEERYSLTGHIRRSSRSVCANIAEAWQKRRYQAAFVSKLCDADGEAAETIFWLAMSFDCGYIATDTHTALHDRYKRIGAQLGRTLADAEWWCRPVAHSTTASNRPPSTVNRPQEE